MNEKYFEAVGRRKTATARVRIFPSSKESIIINDKSLVDYFQIKNLQELVLSPYKVLNLKQKFNLSVKVSGGGVHAQAEAIRHGLSRCLVKYDENLKADLKKSGFLKRDQREVERKKAGLKKARKAPTWSKR